MVEPDGFREFVALQSRALLRTAWLLTGDWSTAEDLVQTALAKAWPHWAELTRPDAPELYVRKVMISLLSRWRRRRWTGEIATGALPDAPSGDALEQVDLQQSLRAVVGRLPLRQRSVVVLRYFADLSEAQTAAVLGCSVGTVKSQASKALAQLREMPGVAEMMSGGHA